MTKKSYLTAAAIIASITTMTPALFADNNTDQAYQVSPQQLAEAAQNGYFIGLMLGYTKSDWGNFLSPSTITDNGDGGLGIELNGGYRWNNRLAIETGFEHIPKVKYTNNNQEFSVTSWLSYTALELDAPISGPMNAFLQAGLGIHYIDDTKTKSESTILPYYAVGVSYTINQNIKASFKCSFYSSNEEIDGHNGYVPTVSSFMLGAQYMF